MLDGTDADDANQGGVAEHDDVEASNRDDDDDDGDGDEDDDDGGREEKVMRADKKTLFPFCPPLTRVELLIIGDAHIVPHL